jgi:hypothetical protein
MEEQKYIPPVDISKSVAIPLDDNGFVRWMVQSFTRKAFYFHNSCTLECEGSQDAHTIGHLLKTSKFPDKIFVVNTPSFLFEDKTLYITNMLYDSILELISKLNNFLEEGHSLFLYQNKISPTGKNYIRFAKFKNN